MFVRYKFRKESAQSPASGVRRNAAEADDNYVALDAATVGQQSLYAVLQLSDQRRSDGAGYAAVK